MRVQKRLIQLKASVPVSAFTSTGRGYLPQGMATEHSPELSLSAAINSHGDFWNVTLQRHIEESNGSWVRHISTQMVAMLQMAGQAPSVMRDSLPLIRYLRYL